MTLAFDFHPEAQAEFAADVDWYDAREPGVGGRNDVSTCGRHLAVPLRGPHPVIDRPPKAGAAAHPAHRQAVALMLSGRRINRVAISCGRYRGWSFWSRS
ncbi:MAG: hypothetical protein ACYC1Z_06675 [Georgenia sp.]